MVDDRGVCTERGVEEKGRSAIKPPPQSMEQNTTGAKTRNSVHVHVCTRVCISSKPVPHTERREKGGEFGLPISVAASLAKALGQAVDAQKVVKALLKAGDLHGCQGKQTQGCEQVKEWVSG